MDDTQLLTKVNQEYMQSRNATAQKRIRLRDRLKLLVNSNKEDDKVVCYLIRSYVNTLTAMYFEDGLKQNWQSRDLYSFLEADNLNAVAKFDYDEMKMASKDYRVQRHRLTYGVGVRVWTGRDYDMQYPDFEIIHPLNIYPDPLGHTEISNFRYFGFERITSLDELREMGVENFEQVEAVLSSEMALNLYELGFSKELNITTTLLSMREEYKKTGETTVYYHYTMCDGKPHQILTFGNCLLLQRKEIKPISQEKSAMKKLKFPIALNYYEPSEDPRGTSLPDILEDKQKNKTLIMNLMRIKAVREALGGDTLIDAEILKLNKSILSKPGIGRRYLPVSDMQDKPLSSAVYEMKTDTISPDVYNLRDLMEREAQSDSGIDNITRGMSSGDQTTATEIKTKQLNANVNLVLGNTINSRGERDFWLGRYYFYKYYMPEKTPKIIRMSRGISTTGQMFRRKDLISGVDPDITIENVSQIESKRKEEGQVFLNYLPMWLNDPSIKPVSKRFLQRKGFRYMGFTSQEIEITVPYTPEEMEAKQHVLLLNKNIPVKVGELNEDHYTFIVIYTGALDTDAKRVSIEARKEAYILSGQQQQQQAMSQQTNNGIMNSVANQGVAKQMQGQVASPSNFDV